MTLLIFLILLAIMAAVELLIYRLHALDDLSLDVHFSTDLARFGEIIEVVETAQNNKRTPLPFLLLKFESPVSLEFLDMTNTTRSDLLYREDMLTMKPFSRHTRRIKAKCMKRGYYSFARVNITTSDLLLIEKFTRDFDNSSNITILPEEVDVGELHSLMSITFSDIQQRRTLLTDPVSFSGIREYQPWDPIKTINWTATARSGDFMVNQNASTSMRQVTILLNLECYNRKHSDFLLEKSISLAYSYMLQLCEAGIPCSLYTNGKDILTGLPVSMEPSSNVADMPQRGGELARIDLNNEVLPFAGILESHIVQVRSDDFTVIISPRNDSSFQESLINILPLRSSLLWVMPCYRLSQEVNIERELTDQYYRWETVGHD
ncbi:MAG: DUF58 domain-containing protein [Clostridiales bacterium]|nr:DUF58 domain-containing protein [Clostridiales bacterium]